MVHWRCVHDIFDFNYKVCIIIYSSRINNSHIAYCIILLILLTILILLNQWSFHHILNEAEITGNGSNGG